MLAATLPHWVNPDNARNIALGVGIGSLVIAVFVLRFVQKLMTKALLTGLLLLVGAGAWYQRSELADCAKTCHCRVLHQDITIPVAQNPTC